MKKTIATVILGGLTALFTPASPASANLIINATYDSSLSASSITVIQQAINFYQSTFTNPITVNIDFFNMASGLGESQTFITTQSYQTYYNDLIADATSANDSTALTNTSGLAPLGVGAVNPVTGSTSITMKVANARAVGINVGGGTLSTGSGGICNYTGDSCIGLNLGFTNDTDVGSSGGYSLLLVTEHEIDEALGLGSALSGTTAPNNPAPEDLFRFSSNGVRNYVTNSSTTLPCTGASTAYFSINGGATNLDGFNNCNNGGDYGDWVTHTPTQVQDAFTNNTGNIPLSLTSPEVTALDVIGYTLSAQAAPEPTTLAILSLGLAGIGMVRRKRARR